LAEDLDFRDQPLVKHLERARLLGAKYLVIFTPWMKTHLAEEKDIKVAFNCGDWTVFELQGGGLPAVRALPFKPALVVSGFSLKQRRENDYDFVRFAEEQFIDGWFEVLLVRSPDSRIDRIRDLNRFGALVLDRYEAANEEAAFNQLREFAQRRALVLLSSESPLFRRIQASISDFPLAQIVERSSDIPGRLMGSETPTQHYGNSSIRKTWLAVRQALDQHKVASGVDQTAADGIIEGNTIQINAATSPGESSIPTVVATTFFPEWHRSDGEQVYTTTPFFMLTFVEHDVSILYKGNWLYTAALGISACTLTILCLFPTWSHRKQFRGKH
jgi:hypothetical protein